MDPDPLCQCRFSSFVGRFIRSPSFSKQPAEFLHFLARQLREQNYDVMLPTHEQVYLLSCFRDSIGNRVGLAMPRFDSLERMQNKAAFSRLLAELGLPQPETVMIRERERFDRAWKYPFFLKLPHSTAGSGVFQISGREDLQTRLRVLEQRQGIGRGTEVIVQQPGRGVLSTVQAIFNRGQMVGVHTFEARRLGVGGMSTARVSARHTIVHEHAAQLARIWTGTARSSSIISTIVSVAAPSTSSVILASGRR